MQKPTAMILEFPLLIVSQCWEEMSRVCLNLYLDECIRTCHSLIIFERKHGEQWFLW